MKDGLSAKTLHPMWFLLLLWAVVVPLPAEEPSFILLGEQVLSAKVVAIRQGGVLALVSDGRKFELRLASIRLPQEGSFIREAAEKFLRKQLLGKSAEAHILGSGSRGEPWTGHVVLDGSDTRIELARRGLARYCPRNMREAALVVAESTAQSARRGIWGQRQGDTVPPCGSAVQDRRY